MVTLVLDTAFNYLNVFILDSNNQVIDGVSELCPKRQSESIMPVIDELFKANQLTGNDITQVVVTNGPGSYTGLRIALTVAKILAIDPKVKIGTLNALDLIFGINKDGYCIMDARSKRAYYARYENGERQEIGIEQVDVLNQRISANDTVTGQASLIGREDNYPDFKKIISSLMSSVQWVENSYQLQPLYLKDNSAYDTHSTGSN